LDELQAYPDFVSPEHSIHNNSYTEGKKGPGNERHIGKGYSPYRKSRNSNSNQTKHEETLAQKRQKSSSLRRFFLFHKILSVTNTKRLPVLGPA